MASYRFSIFTTLALSAIIGTAHANDHSMESVNFTGPLLTPNAVALPPGTINVEPYLVYADDHAIYGAHGHRHTTTPGTKSWTWLVPTTIGITDRLNAAVTLGAVSASSKGIHTDGARIADTTLKLQYMLLAPSDDGMRPAVSVAYAHRFPTGAFDHLDANPLNGSGNGANVDTLSLFAQKVTWMPNGRPLRMRAYLAWSPTPRRINLKDVSVYDTPSSFRGHAYQGKSLSVSGSLEYSIDRHWGIAVDLAWDYAGSTRVSGAHIPADGTSASLKRNDPSRRVYSMAPAVEYNINDSIGVIAGVQASLAGRRNQAFVQPQVALNMVF